MSNEKRGKNIVIAVLLVSVLCLSIAFSNSIESKLDLGAAMFNSSSKWDVGFTSVSLPKGSTGTVPTFNKNSVTYTVTLVEGRTYEFDAVISNKGTYDAKLDTLTTSTVPDELSSLVSYEITGITEKSIIDAKNGNAKVHVKINMENATTEEEKEALNNSTLTLTLIAVFEQV